MCNKKTFDCHSLFLGTIEFLPVLVEFFLKLLSLVIWQLLRANLRLIHTQTHERVHYQHTQPLDGPLSQPQADAHTDASMFIINTHNRLMALCPNLRLIHTQARACSLRLRQHTHNRSIALCPGLPGSASIRRNNHPPPQSGTVFRQKLETVKL